MLSTILLNPTGCSQCIMHASQMLLTLEPPVSICNRDCDGMSIAAELRKLKVCQRACVRACVCVCVCVCARVCKCLCARARHRRHVRLQFSCSPRAKATARAASYRPRFNRTRTCRQADARTHHTLSLIRHVPLTHPSPSHLPSAVYVQPCASERGRSSRLALMLLVMILALEMRSFNCMMRKSSTRRLNCMMNRKCARSWS